MVGIVNYGAGNIFSLTAALDRVGIGYGMINEEADFDQYERIIIPGVGHAGAAMSKLQESGLIAKIIALEKPVLGICVGMQLLTAYSEEGDADLLHIIPLRTLHFDQRIGEKVPHMGWNSISPKNDCPLFQDVPDNSYFYFVHSYYIEADAQLSGALCNYGIEFSAAIQRDNFFGVQFHPEKSGLVGEQVLRNFAKL
ncbi:imidazole glycerol phosphate synthase subunit HisH [Sphingobacterium oryzagri]|uniref:Imidazole glycerol phosphate synthase subunit HisH n=1 Tax=Sphingobacterium oryzagri TaxID=3025669 RepID=A0ABY7WIC3_9SPHI|nr:imidazole glycerol phosphate synthase subunit HisH [Sphingobacterium sp. KACC 22765]WDF68216.1 imidazole glycerol phosphate synthase subunit HisH [Sphingobacterium sp. KACC 22765]